MRKNLGGMTLMELMIGVVICMLLLAFVGLRTRGLLQRAKVSSAKAAVTMLALPLETVKQDVGIYPADLKDLQSAVAPSYLSIPSRFWQGPYIPQGVSLIDPWGNPYFYEVVEGPVFGPSVFTRTAGGPYDQTFTFPAGPGLGSILIINENDPITSGEIWINGVSVVTPDEFKSLHPRIEKILYLQSENTIRIRLASEPGRSIILVITSIHATDTTFILGSYGRDGEPGGAGFDADIVHGEIR